MQFGDRVLRQNKRNQQRKGDKLDPDFFGPYTVTKVDGKSIDIVDEHGKLFPRVNLDHLVHFLEDLPPKAPKVTSPIPTTSFPATAFSVPHTTCSGAPSPAASSGAPQPVPSSGAPSPAASSGAPCPAPSSAVPCTDSEADSVETSTRSRTQVQGENRTKPPVGQAQQAPGSRDAIERFIIREKARPQLSFQPHDVTSAVASFPPSLSPRDVKGPPADTLRPRHIREALQMITEQGYDYVFSVVRRHQFRWEEVDKKGSESEDIEILSQVGLNGIPLVKYSGPYRARSNHLSSGTSLRPLGRSRRPSASLGRDPDAAATSPHPPPRAAEHQLATHLGEVPAYASTSRNELQKEFPDIPIGYSGHETGIHVSVAAVALGAKVLERHVTLDKSWKGSDHAASLEPAELAELVKAIRTVEMAMGSPIKQMLPCEASCHSKLGKSVVARKPLQKGEMLTLDMLTVKVAEPHGVRPENIFKLVGKKIPVDLEKDATITDAMIKG
ncbi:hypothetical protein G5714_023928 [Onychostoma macrolepis]|uniref:AFP-like domain-containing protein n=1 Tax=Onychostoma macrolepis TaxID=369639 RepID=A0A7J6BI84_9TELE|nr:hypothetical protein G5714_023928 [Onychostoma macrolepis]